MDNVTETNILERDSSIETDETFKDPSLGQEGLQSPTSMRSRATIPGRWIQEPISGRWWYRHNNGSYTVNGWESIHGFWYHFDAEGWMRTGWVLLDRMWHYFEPGTGRLVFDWQLINGKYYYFNRSGQMVTGWLQINGIWYFLESNGVMVTGWKQLAGVWYYFHAYGQMNTAPLKLGDSKNPERVDHFTASGAWKYRASTISWHLLDRTKHLDWSGSTVFMQSFEEAIKRWNQYAPGVIRRSTSAAATDVVVSDYWERDGLNGIAWSNGRIEFNKAYMEPYKYTTTSLNVAMHEIGHALGLGHNDANDVMYFQSNNVIGLTANDRGSYIESAKRY